MTTVPTREEDLNRVVMTTVLEAEAVLYIVVTGTVPTTEVAL